MKSTFVIAEAGVNHNGSINTAMELIDVAVESGADAVKFQSFNASELATQDARMAEYQLHNTGRNESQYEMLRKLELGYADHEKLIEYCQNKNIQFLSTPFDEPSLSMLVNRFNIPLIKISSGDLTNAPFLLSVARTLKPVILSTGMSTIEEVECAISVLVFGYSNEGKAPSKELFQEAYIANKGKSFLKDKITLLHCTSEYPAAIESVNLAAMDVLKTTFGFEVGYSDHTRGITIAIAAVARGATVIEKHFTLDRSMEGPDHKASLEPGELRNMVCAIREVEKAMGDGVKEPSLAEQETKKVARKSLVAGADIKKGDVFTEQNIAVKRPGGGMEPICYWDILGTGAKKDYKKDELL